MVNYYNASIIDAKHGDVQVSKLVYGSEVVWEHTQPVVAKAWQGFNAQGVLIDDVACKSTLSNNDISSNCVSGEVGGCVTELSSYAFDSKSISAITLNEGLTTVGHECFQDCSSLTSVTFPTTVTSLGFWVFSRNTSLQWIEFQGLPPSLESYSSGTDGLFHDMSPVTIYVSCDYYDVWMSDQNWSAYTDYIVARCDYANEYLTTVAKTNGTISFSGSVSGSNTNALSYSTDNGTTWSTAAQTPSVSVNAGDKVLWKGTCTPNSSYGIGRFTVGTAQFDVEGNVMSLLYGDNFKGQTSLEGMNDAFTGLFSGNTNVISAENLSLPAMTLSSGCYYGMFNGCTSLTTAPQLPATSLAQLCYAGMFQGCTSLTTAPELSSTTLAGSCYGSMFYDCTSLTEAPELPAMTLTNQCYNSMFRGCTSLTSAPALPATTLANWCYGSMFGVCRSLTTAPALPATTLAQKCYASMFEFCTSLTTPPVLSAMTLASECYSSMFYKCTSLRTAPELPATTLIYRCYSQMFDGCSSLNSITCLATDISAYECTGLWVNGVAATGTFTKAAGMTGWTTGSSGIPNGWTVVEPFSGKLEAKYNNGDANLQVACNESATLSSSESQPEGKEITAMKEAIIGDCVTTIGTSAFYGATSLSSVTLPDTLTYINTYAFRGCTSLTSITLPASLSGVGENPFLDCTGLPVSNGVRYADGVLTVGNYSGSTAFLSIPEGVKFIGSDLLYGNKTVTSLRLPSTVVQLGIRMTYSSSARTITCLATTPPKLDAIAIGSNVTAIKVPAASVDAYKAASGWSSYASKISSI